MSIRETVPAEIRDAIAEDSRERQPESWTDWYDRDGEHWAETPYRHDGDAVMVPSAGDMPMMLRGDVVAFFGPLRTPAEDAAHVERRANELRRKAGEAGGDHNA